MNSTPLLDREQPVPEPVKRSRWVSLITNVTGAALGVAITRNWDGNVEPVLLGIVAFYLAVLVHELGHAAAGIAAGFELRGLAVGGFSIHKQTRGWRFRFVRFTG